MPKKNQSRFGNYCEKPKSPTSGSLNFGELPDVILPKLPQKPECGFRRYQMWISQKLPNLDYLTGVFKQFLAKPHQVERQNVTF